MNLTRTERKYAPAVALVLLILVLTCIAGLANVLRDPLTGQVPTNNALWGMIFCFFFGAGIVTIFRS